MAPRHAARVALPTKAKRTSLQATRRMETQPETLNRSVFRVEEPNSVARMLLAIGGDVKTVCRLRALGCFS